MHAPRPGAGRRPTATSARATPQTAPAHTAETWLRESVSSLPQLHRQGTELSSEGPRDPREQTSARGVTTEQPRAPGSRPPLYLHSGFPQPVSGLCPSEQGVIIQLPPGASGPLSAEKFSLRLGPLALCHLWAEDTGKRHYMLGNGPRSCTLRRRSQFNMMFKNLLRDLLRQKEYVLTWKR